MNVIVADDLSAVRTLFREYAASLPFDLGFQGFEAELAALPGDYAPPRGALLVAVHDGVAVGCVGLRPWGDGDVCEMKRLYVRPAARGLGAGWALARAVVEAARAAGYASMRLDTIADMHAAIAMYERLGFVEIPPYRANPIADARYFELRLRASGAG